MRPDARNKGIGRALLAGILDPARSAGLAHVSLEVLIGNSDARRLYERLGFTPMDVFMVAPLDALADRLSSDERPPSFGSLHVQTDDEAGVELAVTQFLPRLGRSEHTEITSPRSGWVTIVDELCDHDRSAQRRLGAELSERMGVPAVALAVEEEAVVRFLLFERGRMVDEYLSVPTYYGDLNKADELSLSANPTLAARLTGADPARVRAIARTASSPSELPPARELLAAQANNQSNKLEHIAAMESAVQKVPAPGPDSPGADTEPANPEALAEQIAQAEREAILKKRAMAKQKLAEQDSRPPASCRSCRSASIARQSRGGRCP